SSASARSFATSLSLAPCWRASASIGPASSSTSETRTISGPTWAAMPSTSASSAAARPAQSARQRASAGARSDMRAGPRGRRTPARIAPRRASDPGRGPAPPARAGVPCRPVGARRAPRSACEARGADARAARGRAAAAALALLLPLGALAVYGALSPEIALVAPGPRAPWIMAPLPVSAQLEQWGRIDVPVTSFARTFARTGDSPLPLRVRAPRGFERWVNGARAASDDGARWREPREVDATPWLRAGANELRVDVARATGPALVEVVAEEEPALGTSSDWQVSIDGEPRG